MAGVVEELSEVLCLYAEDIAVTKQGGLLLDICATMPCSDKGFRSDKVFAQTKLALRTQGHQGTLIDVNSGRHGDG